MIRQRFYEILPGALAWTTLILVVVLSWLLPVWISIFIILFDIYWLLKTAYLSLHLRYTFKEMREVMSKDWLAMLKNLPTTNYKPQTTNWSDIYHLIIFPMYKEPYDVVRESFERLAEANYPKEKLFVVLATEESGGEAAEETARLVKENFEGKFGELLVTKHPSGLSGEIPGKGGNETWAAKEAKRLLIDPLIARDANMANATRMPQIGSENSHGPFANAIYANSQYSHEFADSHRLGYENILVSSFDIDTQILPEYFGRLTYVFLSTENNLRAIYQPVPFFTNNVYQAPAIARVISFSSTFWQMMQQARPERLTTFSSQSIPFRMLLDVGYWNTDVVSEDSRIFWQGYLHYHGDFRVVPLQYPVSMDANVAPGLWQTLKNLYKQQRRWGWGVENIPYMLDGFRKDKKISAGKKRYWTFTVLEGFHSWATNSFMIFALGWLPIFLGGTNFRSTLLSYSLPDITRFIIEISMLGIASSAILGILLLPPKPVWFKWYHYGLYILQWAFIPVTLIIFGAIPGLEAQTRLMLGGRARLGFWVTPKHRK